MVGLLGYRGSLASCPGRADKEVKGVKTVVLLVEQVARQLII